MLFCYVWCFACFNMTVTKNLMKKISFCNLFSKCLCSFSTSQFFLFGKPFSEKWWSFIENSVSVPLLVFLSLNNPSQEQYISIRKFLEGVFYSIKKSGKKVGSMKFFDFKKLSLVSAINLQAQDMISST